MNPESKHDFSMFKREDSKYEFEGKTYNSAKELEEHFDKMLKMTQRVSNSWIYKLLTWRSRRKQRKQ